MYVSVRVYEREKSDINGSIRIEEMKDLVVRSKEDQVGGDH